MVQGVGDEARLDGWGRKGEQHIGGAIDRIDVHVELGILIVVVGGPPGNDERLADCLWSGASAD